MKEQLEKELQQLDNDFATYKANHEKAVAEAAATTLKELAGGA